MKTRRTGRASRAGILVASVLVLSACSGGSSVGDTEPVEVEVGKAFTWNGFKVLDGWTLESITGTVGGEEMQQPKLRGDVVNEADQPRAAIFDLVFYQEGKALTSVHCSSAEIAPDDHQVFDCPGLGRPFPSDYDAVRVEELKR